MDSNYYPFPMEFFNSINMELFDSKIKIKNKPKWLKKLTEGYAISFFNYILVDDIRYISLVTIIHEIQHYIDRCSIDDNNKVHTSLFLTMKFYILYLFPQVLAIFSFLAFINPIALLVFLPFLAPIKAPFRVNYEYRGYFWNYTFMQMSVYQIEEIFTGKGYYFMDNIKTTNEIKEKLKKMKNNIMTKKDKRMTFLFEKVVKRNDFLFGITDLEK